ncbi:DUF6737 family protein [Vacuolonema iberomarrocanum]|uniref:DUF6737 family protein n=1 Tax=Vacuolonema iberomarrocanum TaxID=3454632 RepID=UPI001A1079E9|nr:hypothetical protein [filamentous cyanobacterium LEGE 07170]
MTNPPSKPSLWQQKPWWCQPWSIVLTGITIPSVAWVLTHRWWIFVPVTSGILLWWFVFLYLVPRQYAELASEAEHSD